MTPRNDINVVTANKLCFGCGTCRVVCGVDAITMRFNAIGQLLPEINPDRCVHCGRCYDICPGIHDARDPQDESERFVGNVAGVYVGRATDDAIFSHAQSGGLATAGLTYLFRKEMIDAAVVCRIEYGEDYTSCAVVVTSAAELAACQGSSYAPVDMVSALKATTTCRSVAVVGTGCHIQGVTMLMRALPKRYGNITYRIGLICDRVLCRTATEVLYGDHFVGKAKKLIWRDKSLSYQNARLLVENSNGERAEVPSWRRHELKKHFTSPRCLLCYDKLNNLADITLGDPWGMKAIDRKHGNSLIITRTEAGAQLIAEMAQAGDIAIVEASLSEAVAGQAIDAKRARVNQAVASYRVHGWLLPDYCAEPAAGSVTSSLAQIDAFIADAALPKEKIIKKYTRRLNRTERKNALRRRLKQWLHGKF